MDAKKFFLNEQHSDVAFIVGPENSQPWRFPAHRFIMTVASQVFERMFTGNFKEKDSGYVRVTDTNPIAFKYMLQHIYNQEVHLDNVQLMYQVLQVAQKYVITSLVDKCIALLIPNLDTTTFLPIFHLTHEIEEDRKTELLLNCLQFLDNNVSIIIKRNEFVLLDRSIIEEILDRDSLKVSELDLFNGIIDWAKHQCCIKKYEINQKYLRNVLGSTLYKIRFFNMNWEEFDNAINQTEILLPEERKCFMKHYLNLEVKLKSPWDLNLLRRPRNLINHLQFRFWETVGDNFILTKSDTLYVTFTCDIILEKVFFTIKLDDKKLILLRGTISDLYGLVIYKWNYKKTFSAEVEPFQRIQIEVPSSLNAFKCYALRVMCFSGSLSMGGNHTMMLGRYNEPKQVILHCKSDTDIAIDESWKTADYWKKYFADFVWQDNPEPLNLNSAFEKIEFFVVKRNEEAFIV